MHAWAMEPGQRIGKVHDDSQQLTHEDHDSPNGSSQSPTLTDAAIVGHRAAHQITASDLNTFTTTFPVNKQMKFVMFGDALISTKATSGVCERRTKQQDIVVRATLIHVRIWSVSSALESAESRV